MGFKDFLILVIFYTLSFISCKNEVKTVTTENDLILTPKGLSSALEAQFDRQTTLVCQDNLPFLDTLRSIYANRDFQPFWWNAILKDSTNWIELQQTFAHSELHGMDARYYYLPVVEYHRKKIETFSTADSAYQLIAECELIISNGLLRMREDITNGRTNPKTVYGYTYMLPRNNKKNWNYTAYLQNDNKLAEIDAIHSGDTAYNKILKVLYYYLEKKRLARNTSIDFSQYPKLQLGDSGAIISQIILKLKSRNLPDSSIQHLADTTSFTADLQNQIKKLQEKYNLTPDGILGYKTFIIINTTPQDKIDQVKANLERERWFHKPKKGQFVYLNLPEYNAYLHWEDSIKAMKVCIGKNLPDNYDAMVKEYTDSGWLYKLPQNMETPQIASQITYLEINPTWTIPYSIIRREMWWKLLKDATYLSRNGYKVFKGDIEINGDTIKWNEINKNQIPYTIVQVTGPQNALGTVKFMFNNPFSIYLHDTPNKNAFKRTQRAVSHGCVRLEQPILFGEFLMQNNSDYDADDFRILMGFAPHDKNRLEEYDPTDSTAVIQKLEKTSKIHLDTPMPLYLDYRTLYYDQYWNPHFTYDIYDQNKLIIKAMDIM